MKLAGVDQIIVALYVLLLLLVGSWRGKISGREAFLISERKLGGLYSGITISASKIGGGLLVTYSAMVFAFGIEAMWLFAGYVAGYVIFYLFAQKLQRESQQYKYYTLPDYFEQHHGRRSGLVVGVLCVVAFSGWILTNVIAGGALLGQVAGMPAEWASVCVTIIIAVYIAVGGFHSVVRTDVLQYFALFVVAVLIVIALPQIGSEAAVASPKEALPVGRIITFFLVGMLFPMGSAELWQRVYATPKRRDLLIAITTASISYVVIGLILSFVCLRIQSSGLLDAGASAEMALTVGIANALGPAFTGLWVIAFGSAVLSSADTCLFTAASALSQDVFERGGLYSSRVRVAGIRIVTILLALATIGSCFMFRSVVDVTFFFAGLTMAIGAIALATWIFPRISGVAVSLAVSISLPAAALHSWIYGVSIQTILAALGGSLGVLVAVDITWRLVRKSRT